MFSSKKAFLMVLFSILFLQGCIRGVSKPSPNEDQGSKSTDFRVLQIQGTSISKQKNETWAIPTQKTYEFRVCFVGRSTNAQLPSGQKFEIIKPDNTLYTDKTDDLGCIKWSEVLDFNFTSDSTYIKKTRRIKSRSAFKGEAEVQIGVNPWLDFRDDTGSEVIDLSRTAIADNNIVDEKELEMLNQGLLTKNKNSIQLLIDPNLNFELIPVKDIKNGKVLKLVLRLKPYIEAKNLRGSPEPLDLTKGKYKIFAQLVSDNVGMKADQHTLLTPEILPQDKTVLNSGILSLTMDFTLNRQIDMGQVKLALKIQPINTPYPLKAYEGLHNIGSFSSILGSSSAPQVMGHLSDQNFSYAEFIKSAVNFEDLKKQGIAVDLPPVYFDYLEPRFIRIKSGETSTQRTIMYRVSTVVRDSITGDPKRFQKINIKKHFTKTEETKTSDENGILFWEDELNHLYYKPEQYFFPEFTLTQMVSDYSLDIKIGVNPWDFGWTFGEDTRRREAFYADMASRRVNPPEFMIDAFRYQTIRFRYVIDEYLTLNVKKAVVMALDPLVERNTINEGRKFEPLRNGIYLVKIALVKYYLDPFQNNTRLVNTNNESEDPLDPEVQCPGFGKNQVTKDTYVSEDNEGIIDGVDNDNKKPEDKKDLTPNFKLEAVSCNGEAKKGQYTTVIKKLLRVQAGRITTPLEFSMRDLRMMSIRSNIMIQLETIDENRLLRDNIINSKLDTLVSDYYTANTEGMTPEERDAFIKKKQEEYFQKADALRDSIANDLKQIESEREIMNMAYSERDKKLSDLEESFGDVQLASNSEKYKEILNLPQKEFMARVNKARTELNQLHDSIESYWSDYKKSWVKYQIDNSSKDGLLSIPREQLSIKPSYMDYLATMQHFLDDFGLGLNVSDHDLEELEINNYTNNPLIPLVNLDKYVEDSGLAKRTFIGPCTLVENDNMSELRPTDKIDEAYTAKIDNSQDVYVPLKPPVDNREFEQSAYHDSLIPFKDKHVDDYIAEHIENEKHYEKEMMALSQMGRYVKAFNLEYVSLTDQPLMDFKEGGCTFEPGEDCFIPTTNNKTLKSDFLKKITAVTDQELLSRYFFVRPLNKSKKVNKTISEESTLEPLWTKSKREFFGLLPSNDDNWLTATYANGGIGNQYHWSAKNYLKNNAQIASQTNDEKINNWIKKGVSNFNLLDATRICSLMTKQISNLLKANNLINEKKSFWSNERKSTEDYLLEYCFSNIHLFDQESITDGTIKLTKPETEKISDRVYIEGISFDRRYRVIRTGPYQHIAGKNTNLNVGVDFSIGNYEDLNSVATLGLNGGALLGLPAIGAGAYAELVAASAIATGPMAPITAVALTSVAATLGGIMIAQKATNKAKGINMSQSTSVNMATYLVIQKAEMNITIEEHEKCLSFQFNPEAINNMNFQRLHLADGITHRNLELRNALSRGYILCEGKPTNEPVLVRENYYYITQHFTAGDMLDEANLLNHVWLLALRGQRDYNTFIDKLKNREVGPDGEIIQEDKLNGYSLSRLNHVYDKVLPTFPGMYSVQDPLPIKIPVKTEQ